MQVSTFLLAGLETDSKVCKPSETTSNRKTLQYTKGAGNLGCGRTLRPCAIFLDDTDERSCIDCRTRICTHFVTIRANERPCFFFFFFAFRLLVMHANATASSVVVTQEKKIPPTHVPTQIVVHLAQLKIHPRRKVCAACLKMTRRWRYVP